MGLVITSPRTTATGRTTSNEYLMVGLMKVYDEMAAGGFDDEGARNGQRLERSPNDLTRIRTRDTLGSAEIETRETTGEGAD